MTHSTFTTIGLLGLLTLGTLGPTVADAAPPKKPKPPVDSPKPTEETLHEGKINVVRGMQGTPEPRLTDRKGTRWLLTGTFRRELRRLNGHKVKAWGVSSERGALSTLEVRRYEIVDSGGGRRPEVGKLRRGGALRALQLVRADQAVLKIKASRAMTRRLKRRVGCKIWISGEIEGDSIKVFKFGWLRCQKRRPIKPQKKETRQ